MAGRVLQAAGWGKQVSNGRQLDLWPQLLRAQPSFATAQPQERVQTTADPRVQRHYAAWAAGAIVSAAAGAAVAAHTPAMTSCDSARQQRSASALTLYQYEVCPWCNKVKAVLDYKGIPYHVVEVHPLFKSELKWSEYKKVPVMLQADGEQVNESNKIVDVIFSQPAENAAERQKKGWFGRKGAPAKETQQHDSGEEARWRAWADDRLVKVYTANLYRSFKESCQAMEYIFDVPTFWYVSKAGGYWSGAALMWMVGRRMPKKYDLEGKDLREELAGLVNEFVDAVGSKDFLGGKQPDRADLAVFGILRAVPNTDTYRFIMTETRIMPWWRRMVETVGESSRLEELPLK